MKMIKLTQLIEYEVNGKFGSLPSNHTTFKSALTHDIIAIGASYSACPTTARKKGHFHLAMAHTI